MFILVRPGCLKLVLDEPDVPLKQLGVSVSDLLSKAAEIQLRVNKSESILSENSKTRDSLFVVEKFYYYLYVGVIVVFLYDFASLVLEYSKRERLFKNYIATVNRPRDEKGAFCEAAS